MLSAPRPSSTALSAQQLISLTAECFQLPLACAAGKTITIDDIGAADTIETLKTKIRIKVHLVFTQNADFYTIFSGRRLADHHSLNFYNVVSGSTVWMVMRLRGGMDAGALVIAIT